MDSTVLLGFVRHLLTLGGGFLISKGYLDDGQLNELVGAVMGFVGFAWSYWNSRQVKAAITQAATTGVDTTAAVGTPERKPSQ